VKLEMAKKKARSASRKDSVTLTKNGFIVLVLFVVAITMLAVYAYMGYAPVK
jgi:hypothetical protein